MELDLDAFLDSHNTTDDDDDQNNLSSLPSYRTVDEILLNDSSSDSDSETVTTTNTTIPPPNSNHHQVHDSKLLADDRATTSSTSGYSSRFSGIKLGQVSTSSFSNVVPSQLPSLFGVVRSNSAKPGAALAAAAAASRSIPTPHAAAIKLRRAKSSTEDLESKSSTGSEIIYETGTGFHQLSVSEEQSSVQEDVKAENESVQTADQVELVNQYEIKESPSSSTEGKDFSCEEIPSNESKSEIFKGEDALEPSFKDVTFSHNDQPQFGSPVKDLGQDLGHEAAHSVVVSTSGQREDEDVYIGSASIYRSQSVGEEELPLSELGNVDNVKEDLTTAFPETSESEIITEPQGKDVEFDVAGEDTSLKNEVAQDVEDIVFQQENESVGKRMGKRSRSSLKPLELAEELEKKHAFKGLHLEEGAAAQPMRLEGLRKGSTVLGYFDITADNNITRTISSSAFRRDHGSPQAVAAHLNFIAVGMSRGVIVVFPSKYSPHHPDNMDAKMLILGLQGDRSYAPVTSMCFNQQGDLLFAGYADGHYTVWDIQRVSAAKVVTEHKAPLVHMLYLGQDSQASRQFNVVSGDSKGVVKLIRFSTFSWLNRFSTPKMSTLLDESTSTVICASPLLSDEGFSSPSTSMIGGVVAGDWKPIEGSFSAEEGVVIFVTHQSALVAKVISNTPEVYAQLPKPDGVREGSMPYTAWKYMPHSQGSAVGTESVPLKEPEAVPLLAIAWDRKVQVAKLVKSELKIYAVWTLGSSAVGVSWLDDQMLVVLTSDGQLSLYAKDGTVIHQTSFSIDGSRGDDLIGCHTHFNNIFGNPVKAHHNFIAVRGATLYLLGPTHLVVSRLLPWKERIEVLRKAGDWMGALHMAMTLYDGEAHGVIDLPRTLVDVQKTIMPYLVELLFSYVDEVFSYISVAFGSQIGKIEQSDDSKSQRSSVQSEIKEQFTRVGGVAVEFCVHIKRTDILFDEILSRFVSAQQKETFLELLEPYILKDMLGSLPPEVMQALVEHYSMKGWLQRVEQCVLHMDISSLDFNQVVRLCREHRLYGALIYLFNKGLNDFKTPLEELLVVLRDGESESASNLGYRILVYLKYCFSGLAFPPGHGTISSARLPSLRMELIEFLLECSNAESSRGFASLLSTNAYKNLYHLLELDTEATLDVLRSAFIEGEILEPNHLLHDSQNSSLEPARGNVQNLVQEIVNALTVILETGGSINTNVVQSQEAWPSKDVICYILEFISSYVACGKAKVSKRILGQILEYLTLTDDILLSDSRQYKDVIRRNEMKVLALLEAVTETDWDHAYLLQLCEKAQFYQVCGFIHGMRHQYLAAVESYMKDVDEPIHAFSFIYDLLQQPRDKKSDSFEAEIISRIPDLVQLSREGTFFLAVDHFSQESQQILAELRSFPSSLFLFLKTVIEVHSTGTLNFSRLRKADTLDSPGTRRVTDRSRRVQAFLERISNFPKLLRDNPVHVTDEMTELYLELLCQYERSSVLPFLETCESYRVEHCLRLCQEHGIIDASAFLLERVGDVGSALLITLSDLNNRFRVLNTAVQNIIDNAGLEHFNTILKKKEVTDILDIVHACVGLCQRNSSRLDPDESETLWFQLLDSFCEPLVVSHSGTMSSEGQDKNVMLAQSLDRQTDEEASKIKWKVTQSDKGAHILRKLFSMFIKVIVEGMIGYVRLPTIMLKLLSDNGSQEFGDFKVTILGMLGTYDFEKRILDTAKSLIEDDTYYTMSLLKKGASHGYGPRSLLCCICNCLLTKGSSTSGIRVFSCGHATHLHCELQEKETSNRISSTGCPVCMPKKKGLRSKSNSILAENGLLSKPLSKHKLPPATGTVHPHEHDTFDGFRQISRFEMLCNLQKEKRLIQIEQLPQLRLAPPAIYHEKVNKGIDMLRGESSNRSRPSKLEKTNKSKKAVKDLKVKGSSIRLPLKSNIFGKEKTSKR